MKGLSVSQKIAGSGAPRFARQRADDLLARGKMNHIDLEDARAALKEARVKGTISLGDLVKKLGD